MDLTLYHIATEVKEILHAEEWTDETEAALASLEMSLETKADACAAYIANIDGFIAAAKAEEERIAARRKVAENRAEQIKDYLFRCLKACERTKIEAGTRTISIAKNPPSVVVDEESVIPARFFTIIPETMKLDRKAVGAALKAGEDVPGCHLHQGERLAIR